MSCCLGMQSKPVKELKENDNVQKDVTGQFFPHLSKIKYIVKIYWNYTNKGWQNKMKSSQS